MDTYEQLIQLFKKLDIGHQEYVIKQFKLLLEANKTAQERLTGQMPSCIVLQQYDASLSFAGGINKIVDYKELKLTLNYLTKAADFVVKITGHSEHPKIKDGDLLLVTAKGQAVEGETCIFELDKKTYIKTLEQGEMFNLNPDPKSNYETIHSNQKGEVICRGRVMCKVLPEWIKLID